MNECNEIIISELITNDYLDDLNFKELGTILSIFSSGKKLGDIGNIKSLSMNYKYNELLDFINKVKHKFQDKEYYNGVYLNTDWTINTECMNATYEWLDNSNSFNTICNKYQLYEGNFIKDLIKIYNIAATISKIATIVKKNKLFIEANKIMDCIMRDVVTVESLYIY